MKFFSTVNWNKKKNPISVGYNQRIVSRNGCDEQSKRWPRWFGIECCISGRIICDTRNTRLQCNKAWSHWIHEINGSKLTHLICVTLRWRINLNPPFSLLSLIAMSRNMVWNSWLFARAWQKPQWHWDSNKKFCWMMREKWQKKCSRLSHFKGKQSPECACISNGFLNVLQIYAFQCWHLR